MAHGRSILASLSAALCMALAACAPRGDLTFDPAAASVGQVETIFVVTDRGAGPGHPLFTARRTSPPEFLRFEVSVPPDREPGTITYARSWPPDPSTDFLTVAAWRLAGEQAYIAEVNRRLATDRAANGDLVLFLHGFNTNFAEGLYRQAQLYHDIGSRAVQTHFAWPSDAKIEGYLYDRESVLYSRDAVETTIGAMARTDARQLNLFAHSMGALLLMDTLRLMARVGYDEVFARTNAIVLIDPDIEIDVFRHQARPVVARGVPIFIIVSTRDRALLASALIRGERQRLGSIRSTAELGIEDVMVINISDVEDPGFTDHFAIATSPELLAFIRSLRGQGLEELQQRAGPADAGVAILQEGAKLVLAPLTGGQ